MDREVINMENIGVTCDVCECSHNVSGCKCDLPQIKVTEQCTCDTQQNSRMSMWWTARISVPGRAIWC